MAVDRRRAGQHSDDEAAHAASLRKQGGLTLELIGLGVDQFARVCAVMDGVGLDHAVDADGRLVVAMPDAAQVSTLRERLRHGQADLDAALVERLRARRGSRVVPVDDLTALERDDLVRRLGERGYLAAVDDLDVVVERKGAATVGALIGEREVPARADDADLPDSGEAEAAEPAAQAPRLLGMLVDGAILVALVVLLGLGAAAVGADPVLGVSLGFVAFTTYDFLMTSRSGQTLGKRLAHTKVVDRDTHGPLRPTQAMLRSGLHILPLALLGSLGVLLFTAVHVPILLTPERRGLHDLLARTAVLDVKPVSG